MRVAPLYHAPPSAAAPLTGAGGDSHDEGRAGVAEWQTQGTQNPPGFTPRAGSSPASGTTLPFSAPGRRSPPQSRGWSAGRRRT